jgi:hypothetical protein
MSLTDGLSKVIGRTASLDMHLIIELGSELIHNFCTYLITVLYTCTVLTSVLVTDVQVCTFRSVSY